jgi:VanZ family protein
MTIWIKRWGAAILMMMLIFAASATPSDDLPTFGILNLLIYKGAHMLGYALLAVSFWHGLSRGIKIRRRHIVLAFLLSAAYAVSDELHQIFTAGRNPSPVDVLIDAAGAALGLAIGSRIRNLLCRKQGSLQV